MVRDASSSEVGAALGLSSATVQRYARDGRIPFTSTPGGHRRFDLEEVRRALGHVAPTQPVQKLRTSVALEVAAPTRPVPKVRASAVVLTALPVEFREVLALLPGAVVHRHASGTRYHLGELTGDHLQWSVAVAEVGEGNVGAAVETTRAIDYFDPDIVLFVGVAGSLKIDVVHGSVVVANTVYRYHSGKAAEDFLSRPRAFPTWHGLEQLVRDVRHRRWTAVDPAPLVELKPIAAGDVVIASKESETFRLLHERCNDAVAVDMESAGVYEAAHRAGIAALAVRGISDMVVDKAAAADAEWQPIASRHAAQFAFALLRVADPGDFGLTPPPNPYPTEGAALLASLPPAAASLLERDAGSSSAHQVLRALANRTLSPSVRLEAALQLLESQQSHSGNDVLRAVAEFAVAHSEHLAASRIFEQVALSDRANASRLYARAALAAAASGLDDRAAELLAIARSSDPDTGSARFVEVVAAAISEDAESVLTATDAHGPGDGYVDLLRVRALSLVDRPDDALAFGLELLRDHPNRAFTGGLALETSRLLLMRSREPDRVVITSDDAGRAFELALEVRDFRREWDGPSGDAARVAAAAAGAMRDFETVLRIVQPAPEGEATATEASDSQLAILGANAAIALGEPDRAREIARRIDDQTERLLVEVDAQSLEGQPGTSMTEALIAALPDVSSDEQLLRSYVALAHANVWPLDGLDAFRERDPEGAALVEATRDVASGDIERAARRLRAFHTLRATLFLVEAYVTAGRIDDAVSALRVTADRYGRAELRLQAAVTLASVGRLEEAYGEAVSTIATVRQGTRLYRDLRRLCIDLTARLRDWSALVEHARAALADDEGSNPQITWAMIGGLFNLRELDSARRLLMNSHPVPSTEDEALLAVQLLRSGVPNAGTVAWVLDIAEDFSESEVLTANAFGAVLEMSHELELPDGVAERLRRMPETFVERWPHSDLLALFDVADPSDLAAYLKERVAPGAEVQQQLATEVALGRLPLALLTAIRGRTLGELLITQPLGCLPIGSPGAETLDIEDRVASDALDGEVVVDAHALFVSGKVDLDVSRLMAAFTRVVVARSTLDDLLSTAAALRLESTMTVGWDPRNERPIVVEIEPEVAARWHRDADDLLDRVRQCQVKSDPETPSDALPSAELSASLELARRGQRPLWSDDPAIRQIARSEGIRAFGTLNLLNALHHNNDLSAEQLGSAVDEMVRKRFVDIPLEQESLLRIAADEAWRPESVAWALSRPATWTTPEIALAIYRRCVTECVSGGAERVSEWAYAAVLGAARAIVPHRRSGAIATLVMSGFLHAGSEPLILAELLDGARSAASTLDLGDPLTEVASLLRSSLFETIGAEATPRVFVHFTSRLGSEDRLVALEQLVRPRIN